MFDKETVREYYKHYEGFLFSKDELVRRDTIKTELVLKIDSERIPDKIIFNGKEVTLS